MLGAPVYIYIDYTPALAPTPRPSAGFVFSNPNALPSEVCVFFPFSAPPFPAETTRRIPKNIFFACAIHFLPPSTRPFALAHKKKSN
jgi:hypothetical protein